MLRLWVLLAVKTTNATLKAMLAKCSPEYSRDVAVARLGWSPLLLPMKIHAFYSEICLKLRQFTKNDNVSVHACKTSGSRPWWGGDREQWQWAWGCRRPPNAEHPKGGCCSRREGLVPKIGRSRWTSPNWTGKKKIQKLKKSDIFYAWHNCQKKALAIEQIYQANSLRVVQSLFNRFIRGCFIENVFGPALDCLKDFHFQVV